MFDGVYGSLLVKLACAGRHAEFLGGTSFSGDVLGGVLESLSSAEFDALAEVVDRAEAGGGTSYRHQGSFAPPHPVRRLLTPLTRALQEPGSEPDWCRRHVESRILAADTEALALLVAGVAAERIRRG